MSPNTASTTKIPAGHIRGHRREGIDISKLVGVVATSRAENVSKCRCLILLVGIVTETTGNPELLRCVPIDFGVDLLQVIGQRGVDIQVVSENPFWNAAGQIRYELLRVGLIRFAGMM